MQRNSNVVLALACIVSLVGSSYSYKVRLEGKDDQDSGKRWKTITCRSIEGYEDYNAGKGCPVKPYPLEEIYFSTPVQETWGVCSEPTCNIIYYNGELDKKPANVSIKAIVAGKGKVSILGKRSLLTPSFDLINTIVPDVPSHPQFETWKTRTFDITGNHFVIGISLDVPDNSSFALIDSIELDFGEDVTEPPTTTTTPAPPKFIFEADTAADLPKEFTEISCVYSEHVDELWMWGEDCRNNATEKVDTLGFWTPCRIPSCHFIFDAGTAALSDIQLDGVFRKGASVRISRKPRGLGAAYREVLMQELSEDQESLSFDLFEDCQGGPSGQYNISINGAKGLVMIDRLTVSLVEDYDLPCSTDEAPTTDSDDDDDGGKPGPAPDAGSPIVSSAFTCAVAVLMIWSVFTV